MPQVTGTLEKIRQRTWLRVSTCLWKGVSPVNWHGQFMKDLGLGTSRTHQHYPKPAPLKRCLRLNCAHGSFTFRRVHSETALISGLVTFVRDRLNCYFNIFNATCGRVRCGVMTEKYDEKVVRYVELRKRNCGVDTWNKRLGNKRHLHKKTLS